MSSPVIFITGTGALSKAIVDALSFSDLDGVHVYVYSRSLAGSSWLGTIGNTRARVRGNRQQYTPKQIDWEDAIFLTNELNAYKPSIVIHTTSLQSMWGLKADNKWSRLVKTTGYGTTLPLQCKLAMAVAGAIANAGAKPALINCCYPDAVNYVIKKCGLDVLCGIGNIGIIEQLLLNEQLPGELLMLANHFHVQELIQPPNKRTELPRIWLDKKEVAEPKSVFDKMLIVNDPSLNSITALTCLNLVTALITRKETVLHLPAPHGEIGGYPVFFKDGKIAHIGTKLIDHEAEQQWNIQKMENEGLIFEEEGIRFSKPTADKIGEYSQSFSKGFTFSNAVEYINEFIAFKEKLSSP